MVEFLVAIGGFVVLVLIAVGMNVLINILIK